VFGFMKSLLDQFRFTEYQYYIAVFCLVIFLGNLLGGLLHGLFLAYGGPMKPRKLFDTISFRWCLFSDLLLLIFALYYHAALISMIEVTHVVYWLFSLAAAPMLAIIGSQITAVIFIKKIEANRREYARRLKAHRATQKERDV